MAKPKGPKKQNGEARVETVQASPAAATTAPEIEAAVPESQKTRRPSIVRTESRANLLPINLEDEIRRLAYLLSERRGFEPGHEAEDWLAAEHEIRQRYHQQSA